MKLTPLLFISALLTFSSFSWVAFVPPTQAASDEEIMGQIAARLASGEPGSILFYNWEQRDVAFRRIDDLLPTRTIPSKVLARP